MVKVNSWKMKLNMDNYRILEVKIVWSMWSEMYIAGIHVE